MTPFVPKARIERLAADLWRAHRLGPGFDIDDLVEAMDLSFVWLMIPPVGQRTVAAKLWASRRLIVLNEGQRDLLDSNVGFYRFSVAHEIGHWELHAGHLRAGGRDLGLVAAAAGPVGDAEDLMREAVRPLTPSEARQEHQVDLFATYLIAPGDVFRAALASSGCDGWAQTYRLAETLGFSREATIVRLEEDGLGYRDAEGQPKLGRRPMPGQQGLGL